MFKQFICLLAQRIEKPRTLLRLSEMHTSNELRESSPMWNVAIPWAIQCGHVPRMHRKPKPSKANLQHIKVSLTYIAINRI